MAHEKSDSDQSFSSAKARPKIRDHCQNPQSTTTHFSRPPVSSSSGSSFDDSDDVDDDELLCHHDQSESIGSNRSFSEDENKDADVPAPTPAAFPCRHGHGHTHTHSDGFIMKSPSDEHQSVSSNDSHPHLSHHCPKNADNQNRYCACTDKSLKTSLCDPLNVLGSRHNSSGSKTFPFDSNVHNRRSTPKLKDISSRSKISLDPRITVKLKDISALSDISRSRRSSMKLHNMSKRSKSSLTSRVFPVEQSKASSKSKVSLTSKLKNIFSRSNLGCESRNSLKSNDGLPRTITTQDRRTIPRSEGISSRSKISHDPHEFSKFKDASPRSSKVSHDTRNTQELQDTPPTSNNDPRNSLKIQNTSYQSSKMSKKYCNVSEIQDNSPIANISDEPSNTLELPNISLRSKISPDSYLGLNSRSSQDMKDTTSRSKNSPDPHTRHDPRNTEELEDNPSGSKISPNSSSKNENLPIDKPGFLSRPYKETAMALWKQIRVLHYRNVCIRRHHWIVALFEIAIPAIIYGILAYSFTKHSPVYHFHQNESINPVSDENFVLKNGFFDLTQYPLDLTYAPKNSLTDKIMNKVVAILKAHQPSNAIEIQLHPVQNEAAIENRFTIMYEDSEIFSVGAFGIYFPNVDPSKSSELPSNVEFVIRPVGERFDTNTLVSPPGNEGPSSLYLMYGALAIDWAMNDAILQLSAPKEIAPKVYIQKFPSPTSNFDLSGTDIVFKFLPVCGIFSLTLLFPFLLKNVISEKETGAKELMKMMGLRNWMTWFGWLMSAFMTNIISITIIVIFLCTPIFGKTLLKSSITLLWVYLVLYLLVAVCFSFALCPIFKRPTVGVCVAVILWYATGYRISIARNSPYKFLDNLMFLFPNVALNRGWESFHYFETRSDGADWSDFFTAPIDQQSFRIATVFGSFILQCVIFIIMTWYLDAVRPGPYGIPESLLFFTKPSYWCGSRAPKDTSRDDWNPDDIKTFEPVSRDLKPGIKVRKLKKSFKKVAAVNNVSVNFYQGEITALLGHNGAGKTTTMSMLTGMIPADSGKVIVDEYNIFDNITQFRENLGLCPQHNLLFNYLNVLEHLMFFGLLKGLSKKQSLSEALHLMELQSISSKKFTMVDKLSGGMKRKLSLAIALIGSPKILMLDEPTSGMDPESRREMWNLLLSMRGERTIILTTHFMEEADVLGDRIAIMDHGEVVCFGTSLMLKKLYGAGYYLNILKQKNFTQNRELITSAIQDYIPEAELKSDEGPKLTYILPTETIDAFPNMFTKLESLKNELGISSLGISCTTMEEVFLKVGEIAAEEREIADDNSANYQENSPQFSNLEQGESPKIRLQPALIWQQFTALLSKKVMYSFRRRFMYLIFGIVPILASILSNLLLNGQSQLMKGTLPPLKLIPQTYDFMQVHYRSAESNVYLPNLNNFLSPQVANKIPSSEDVNQYLLKLAYQDENEYYSNNLLALDMNSTSIIAVYNHIAIHSLPIAVDLAYNLILKEKANRTVSSVMHPFSVKKTNPCSMDADARNGQMIFQIFAWIQFFGTSLLIMTGAFIAFPILERLNNAKQLQLMTGVSPALYWFTTLIVDYLYFITVSFLCVLVFILNGNLEVSAAVVLCLILMIAGLSSILFAYFISYFKKSYASAYALYINLNLFVGTYGAIIVYVMMMVNNLYSKDVIIDPFKLALSDNILKLLPQYSFLLSLMCFLRTAFENAWCTMCPITKDVKCIMQPYFVFSDAKTIGLNNYLIAMVFDIVLYMSILILTELGYFELLYNYLFNTIYGVQFEHENEPIEDPDVNEEKDKVDSAKDQPDNITDHLLIVDNLVKKFSRNYAAVRGISFAVKPGECFGLLGVNGAGKTTTFRMITGDALPTLGDCSILNYGIKKQKKNYLSMIGYCPQFDGINEFLTGNEMLELFAKLRGVHHSKMDQQINKWISTLGLQEYKNNLCGTYSGGNKRKLSTAMALIGDPNLVILDEPTSGVDPISRRKLWNVLIESRKRGQAIVFTSHSMDECENLCDRLTIMVSGKMMCIGNVEYLKQRYAQGYTIMVKLGNASELDLSSLKQMIVDKFGSSIALKDEHTGLLNYHVNDPTIPLSDLFSKMQSIRESMNIVEDYQICNTSLEQVFLAFARSEAKIIET